mmetsp:Transcript_7662/g.18700  ORF Transcript_7662/g.18700 Transcript_7662/m.18700 type:complete len:98 (-) Transcript_7662:318-611(-)
MCDELGNNEYMQAYVEEAGGTTLCSAISGDGCSEKEIKYATTWKAKSYADVDKQLKRLEGMKGKKMKPNLKKWIVQRLSLLKQIAREIAPSDPKDEL